MFELGYIVCMSNQNEHNINLNELTFRLTDTPTAEETVLGFMLDRGSDELTESEIRSALELPRSTAHLALRVLASQGLLDVRRVGRSTLYSISSGDALIRSLKIARSVRRAQIAIEPVREMIDLAVLYGSASTGENRQGSDVDLFVVTREKDAVLGELARHQWLQPVVMTSAEHMQLIADGGTYATDLARGIVIRERR